MQSRRRRWLSRQRPRVWPVTVGRRANLVLRPNADCRFRLCCLARPFAADAPLRNPITGIAGCCARAARGHAAAAPPRSVTKRRRSFDHLVGGASSCAGSIPRALDVVRLMTGAPPLPFCSGDERVHDMPRKPQQPWTVPRPSMISRRNASLHLRLQNLPPHERCVIMPNGPPQ